MHISDQSVVFNPLKAIISCNGSNVVQLAPLSLRQGRCIGNRPPISAVRQFLSDYTNQNIKEFQREHFTQPNQNIWKTAIFGKALFHMTLASNGYSMLTALKKLAGVRCRPDRAGASSGTTIAGRARH